MSRLPHTDGVPDEVVIPWNLRNEYEATYRLAGARLVSAGITDLGNGLESDESWEVAAAIKMTPPRSRASTGSQPASAPVGDRCCARSRRPGIVEAVAELPPKENHRRYVDERADLVAFSGGKAMRWAQTTSILAGRVDLVQSVVLQQLPSGTREDQWGPRLQIDAETLPGLPRHGIGRPMKIEKEELSVRFAPSGCPSTRTNGRSAGGGTSGPRSWPTSRGRPTGRS